MIFKYFFISWWLFRLTICDKSFTIVLDTTQSMLEELDVIKTSLHSAFDTASNDIAEYILVPFNYPDMPEPTVSQSSADLITAVNRISATGGGRTCPEISLTAIEKGIKMSKPQSTVFVFTDAYARDGDKLEEIENLCRNTRSQVVIFLTGFCLPSPEVPTATVQLYHDVAKACSGTVLNLDTRDLRQVFRYIREVINVEWTDIITYDTFSEYKELTFSVDSFTKSVLLSVSSQDYPTVVSPEPNSTSIFETILDSKHTQIIRLLEASIGEYKVTIRGNGKISVVLFMQSQLPLRIGFSPEQPRNIKETSRRPIAGRENNVLLEVLSSIKIETIEIKVTDEKERKTLTIEKTLNDDLYLTKAFVEPDKSFRIWINGYDKFTNQNISGSTETIFPQVTKGMDTRWNRPKAKILDDSPLTVDFGTKATLACKVVGYPKPSVWWEDDFGVTLSTPSDGVLLEIPSLYISYVSIENITTNSTIYCKCKNSQGEDSQSIEVYVHRTHTFEVLQTPEDQTIEYGKEGKLFCEVMAYPKAEIKWYHNNTLITPSEDVEIVSAENALVLKRMSLNDVGEYTCEMTNEVTTKTHTAHITISGLEAPQVEVDNPEVVLTIGNWTSLECRITKGKPPPEVQWQFKPKDGQDFGALPDNVAVEENNLKIAAAQSEHNGVYKCLAENIEGNYAADIAVSVQYPPTISMSDPDTLSVKEGEDVALTCGASAYPAPTVHWEMTQDDVLIPLDDRHRTDDKNTHRFKALWKDSGKYHCIATNDIGSAEKTITVNVLVKPYIEPPKHKTVSVRAGGDFVLDCNVTYGNPVPSTKWEFIARDSTASILKRSHSSSILQIQKARFADEGSYFCIAENDVGTDSIKIYVQVQ